MGGDGHGGAGRPRAHDIGEAQARAARAWFELEAPAGAWLAGVGGAPTEGAPFVVGVDEARRGPLPDGLVVVAAVEERTGAALVVRPLGAQELGGEPGGEVDVAHERPDRARRGVHVDLRDGPRSVLEAQDLARSLLRGGAEAVEVSDRPGRT